jgi:hypothetical protein
MLLFLTWRVETIYHIPKGETGVRINDRMLTLALTTRCCTFLCFVSVARLKGQNDLSREQSCSIACTGLRRNKMLNNYVIET